VRLLVLGGTTFVGRALVEAALAGGHDVTLFTRGRTGAPLFPQAERLTGDRDGGLGPLRGGRWDACVDVSGYVPRVVRQSAELLRGRVGRYVFVSSISAYASFAEPGLHEGSPLAELDDPTVEEIDASTYGGLKALCETVVQEVFGERAALVRPGIVAGPNDPTGRFTYWAARGLRGGEALVPAQVATRLQVVDARDLGAFLLLAAGGLSGAYNVVGPAEPAGLADVVAPATAVAVDSAFLQAQGVTPVEVPLWFPGGDGWSSVDASRALAAGLALRPLAGTIAGAREEAPLLEGVGLAPAREAALLDAWRESAA
jgi:2'-hydroxyisoflavone reductase